MRGTYFLDQTSASDIKPMSNYYCDMFMIASSSIDFEILNSGPYRLEIFHAMGWELAGTGLIRFSVISLRCQVSCLPVSPLQFITYIFICFCNVQNRLLTRNLKRRKITKKKPRLQTVNRTGTSGWLNSRLVLGV